MVSVWRIAAITPEYGADDLTGAGAKATGGRWNRPGNAMLYCASSRALAGLETVVHLGTGSLPLNRYLVRIDLPDAVWTDREALSLATAPLGWDALPAGLVSLDYGDAWLLGMRSAVLEAPSVIVPEESNLLINPKHPGTAQITARVVRKWMYDARMR